MNPIQIDAHGNKFRKCHVELAKGFACTGTIHVWEYVSIQGSNVKRSKPWVSCTESRYCNYIKAYKPSEWEPRDEQP